MERAFILHRVFPTGAKVLPEPKVVMNPPVRLLFRDIEEAVGGLREDFFVESLKQAKIRFQYLKSTRGAKTPDYLIQEAGRRLVVEIGGPGKGRTQFKGVKYDRKIVCADVSVPGDDRFPLFLLGYLA